MVVVITTQNPFLSLNVHMHINVLWTLKTVLGKYAMTVVKNYIEYHPFLLLAATLVQRKHRFL